MKRSRKSDIDEFIALPDSQKARIVKRIEVESPASRLARSKPLSLDDQRKWKHFKAKMGRPKVGKGAKTISLTMERNLLKEADAYAKRYGISRAALVAQGIKAVIGSAA